LNGVDDTEVAGADAIERLRLAFEFFDAVGARVAGEGENSSVDVALDVSGESGEVASGAGFEDHFVGHGSSPICEAEGL
jgi:hypothetical protein